MIFINEWLPNPTGNDARGEFIELYNNGPNSSGPVSLSGWTLKTTGKKIASLAGYSIAPGEYLVLKKPQTKLSLKNTDETLSLYDAAGRLADRSSFLGQAQDGQSLSRINYTTDASEHFIWSDPTPGSKNKIELKNTLSANSYLLDTPINHYSLGVATAVGMILGLGAILAAFVIYFLRTDETITKLIFGGDGEVR